jgi:hypothetical protein
MSRPGARAKTVLFTDCAVIRRIRGKLYFMFQLCELRKTQLREVQVRLYVIRRDVDMAASLLNRIECDTAARDSRSNSFDVAKKHHHSHGKTRKSPSGNVMDGLSPRAAASLYKYQSISVSDIELRENTRANADNQDIWSAELNRTDRHNVISHFQTVTMRILHPNDNTGNLLLLCLPQVRLFCPTGVLSILIGLLQVVVHEIDSWSPLIAPPVWMQCNGEVRSWHPRQFQFAEKKPSPEDSTTYSRSDKKAQSGVSSGIPSSFPIAGSTPPLSQPIASKPSSSSSSAAGAGAGVGAAQRTESKTKHDVPQLAAPFRSNIFSGERDGSPSPVPDSYGAMSINTAAANAISPFNLSNAGRTDISYDPQLLGSCSFPNEPKRSSDDVTYSGYNVDASDGISGTTGSTGLDAFNEMINELGRSADRSAAGKIYSSTPDATPPARGFGRLGGVPQAPPDIPMPSFAYTNSNALKEKLVRTQVETEQQLQERIMLQNYHEDRFIFIIFCVVLPSHICCFSREIEIIAIVEGIDPSTGGVVQAKHSYTYEVRQ